MTTMELARFISELRFENLPSSVVKQAKTSIQDFVGVSLFVSKNTPWGKSIAEFVAGESRDGEATIIGHEGKATPARAALANGTMALGFEYEDVHIGSGAGHPYAVVVSAALAMAENEKATGKELITAVVAGYEAMARTAMASGKASEVLTMRRGIYNVQFFGVFGAAAAAGSILHLEPETMAMAFGLAGEHASGTVQSHAEGAWSRRLHGGTAGEDGVSAAMLAKHGFIGPIKILEGDYSVYRAHGFDFVPEKLTEGLGKPYQIMDTWIKRYPCCGVFQATIDLLLDLKLEFNISAYEVKKITVCFTQMVHYFERTDFPNITVAQLSMPFCVATAMLRNKVTPAEFTEQTIRDPEVVAYALEKVNIENDDTLIAKSQELETFPSHGVIQLKDGREYSKEVIFPRGHSKNPMNQEELKAKFDGLTVTVLGKEKAKKLYDLFQDLDQVRDVSQLTKLLRTGP